MERVKVGAIIPARMASSRFPGKPLFRIRGLPVVEHVRRRALFCRNFSEVVVATCDQEIAAVIQAYGGQVCMTSPEHPAATDRVAEAAESLDCTHVVNVQGDEILVMPTDLEEMVLQIEKEPHQPAWNAVAPIEQEAGMGNRSVVKCVVSVSGRILFCFRNGSFLDRKPVLQRDSVRHLLGILAYRRDFLQRYPKLPRTPLEVAESIDQLRIIEHELPLCSVPFAKGYPGINEPQEVKVVEDTLDTDPLQKKVLREVLALGG